MEVLIRLVADSFARHGIEALPVTGQQPSEPSQRLAVPQLLEVLPEHNYRKSPPPDPIP
jgi:hypothetical protein